MTRISRLASIGAAVSLTFAAAASAVAAEGTTTPAERIAAVVNEEIISTSDVAARVQLALLSTGLPDTPESRERVAPQVLRGLIDEKLELQEAARSSIKVSNDEIKQAIGRIAEQNKMTADQLEQILRSHGVPAATLQAQIRAGISWSKLIQRRLRPQIEIGDDEIDAAVDRIKANVGKPEYLVAEIFLAVDNPNQDDEVHRLADRLVEQIRQGGNFAAVARQFSQSADAANGGDLGWVQAGVLPPELDKALHELRPGQLSAPIRDFSGYHVLLMREQRTGMAGDPGQIKLTLRQLVLPVSANAGQADAAARVAQAEEIRKTVSGCDAFAAKARAVGAPTSGDLGSVRLSDLPPEVARVVSSLPAGEVSEAIRDERGLILLMACQRSDPPTNLPSREQIASTLGDERLDMLQRRLLRDLRRGAFVDVRP